MARPKGKIKEEMSIWILLKLKLSTLYALFMCHIVTHTLHSPPSYNTVLNTLSYKILHTMSLNYPQAYKYSRQDHGLIWLKYRCRPGKHHQTSVILLWQDTSGSREWFLFGVKPLIPELSVQNPAQATGLYLIVLKWELLTMGKSYSIRKTQSS